MPMLKKACVADLKSGRVSRTQGFVAICMCHYPRGIAKAKVDTYLKSLAPTPELLDAFHAERDRLGGNHNAAFISMHYQERFMLNAAAIDDLSKLAERAVERDVYIVCQCALDQRCHRELLLIAAKRWFKIPTELRTFSYPQFEARLSDTPVPLV